MLPLWSSKRGQKLAPPRRVALATDTSAGHVASQHAGVGAAATGARAAGAISPWAVAWLLLRRQPRLERA